MKKKFIYLMLLICIFSSTLAYGFVSMEPDPTPPSGMDDMTSTILGVIQWSGLAIATGMIIYIGIKYVMSAANEKAELKQSLINYVIGALVIICATSIATWCVQIFSGETGDSNAGDSNQPRPSYSASPTSTYSSQGNGNNNQGNGGSEQDPPKYEPDDFWVPVTRD